MDYMAIANSLPMWIAAGAAVILVIIQAGIFAKKSYSAGKELGITDHQMKSAMKSSFITSIGPSFVILTGLISLLVTVGAPMAWMRLSFIGSVMFEMMAVGFGAEAVGVKVGVDQMTELAFANAVWIMILGSIGWIVVATISAKRMDKVQNKFAKGDKQLLSIISVAAMLGSFASLSAPHLMALNANTLACIAGGVIMLILSVFSEKKQVQWLKEWVLAIALFGGMIVGAFLL